MQLILRTSRLLFTEKPLLLISALVFFCRSVYLILLFLFSWMILPDSSSAICATIWVLLRYTLTLLARNKGLNYVSKSLLLHGSRYASFFFILRIRFSCVTISIHHVIPSTDFVADAATSGTSLWHKNLQT